MIRTTVTTTELKEALAPLFELLGTPLSSMYASPGITIGANEITFAVAAGEQYDPPRPDGRARGVRVTGELAALGVTDHPQGNVAGELAHLVSVAVEMG